MIPFTYNLYNEICPSTFNRYDPIKSCLSCVLFENCTQRISDGYDKKLIPLYKYNETPTIHNEGLSSIIQRFKGTKAVKCGFYQMIVGDYKTVDFYIIYKDIPVVWGLIKDNKIEIGTILGEKDYKNVCEKLKKFFYKADCLIC